MVAGLVVMAVVLLTGPVIEALIGLGRHRGRPVDPDAARRRRPGAAVATYLGLWVLAWTALEAWWAGTSTAPAPGCEGLCFDARFGATLLMGATVVASVPGHVAGALVLHPWLSHGRIAVWSPRRRAGVGALAAVLSGLVTFLCLFVLTAFARA